jgi:hypothetical protein
MAYQDVSSNGPMSMQKFPIFTPEQQKYLTDLSSGKLYGPEAATNYYTGNIEPQLNLQAQRTAQQWKGASGPWGSFGSSYLMGVERQAKDLALQKSQALSDTLFKWKNMENQAMQQIPNMSPNANLGYWPKTSSVTTGSSQQQSSPYMDSFQWPQTPSYNYTGPGYNNQIKAENSSPTPTDYSWPQTKPTTDTGFGSIYPLNRSGGGFTADQSSPTNNSQYNVNPNYPKETSWWDSLFNNQKQEPSGWWDTGSMVNG